MIGRRTFCKMVAATVVAGSAMPTRAASHKWQIQSAMPETDCDWYVTLKRMKNVVETASGGAVELEIFPAGALVDPDSIVDSVSNGAIDGGHIIAGMGSTVAPSAFGTEMPYGVTSAQQHHDLHYKVGLIDIMRTEYAKSNITLAGIGTSGQLVFMSKKPIKTVDDLSGMKVWTIPNAGWLSNFGAAPTDVPGFDMYSAMRLGTIDGFTWTVGELEGGNLKEVVKYVMEPRLLTPGTHLIFNKDRWDELPEDTRAKIEKALQDAHLDIAAAYEAVDAKAIAAAKDYGVEFITLDDASQAKMHTAAQQFWGQVKDASPSAAEMVKKYQAYLESIGH